MNFLFRSCVPDAHSLLTALQLSSSSTLRSKFLFRAIFDSGGDGSKNPILVRAPIIQWFCFAQTCSTGFVGYDPVHDTTDPARALPRNHHQSGENHIEDSGVWDACPGQDNPSALCIVGAVRSLFSGQPRDHDGPFDACRVIPKVHWINDDVYGAHHTPRGRECQCTDEVCGKGWARANGKGAQKYEGETGTDITATGWHGYFCHYPQSCPLVY